MNQKELVLEADKPIMYKDFLEKNDYLNMHLAVERRITAMWTFLFYFLLIASALTFIIGILRQSWQWMLISGVLLFPDALYFSGYPPYPWVIFVPLLQVVLAILFYRGKKIE